MKETRLLFLLLLLYLVTGVSAKKKIYLVSVGVADYPGTVNDLNLPAKDAQTIQWLYQQNGAAETILLINEKATRANVIHQMKQLFSKATPSDIIVLFFSGHGYKGGFKGYDSNISYDDIRKAMASSRSKNKMIFADACYSGGIRGNKKSEPSSSSSLSSLEVMLFLSSRTDEVSFERVSMQNGMFTTYLQRGLRGGADYNKDRIITAKELFRFVSEGVKKLSKDRQHPVMWGKFDDSMPVIFW